MKLHNLVQGSPEWLAYRATHFNASDAPAMMGCSPYKTRAELLREMHTGVAPDIDVGTQKRFDNGHHGESMARPLAEEIVGEDLYPVVGSEGRYSASFDGLTMAGDVGFEHKSLNADLRAVMVDGCTGADLPLQYRVQMEHQAMVAGLQRILFVASNWRGEELGEMRECWYEPDLELRAQIIAGWEQFAKDLAEFELQPAAAPAPVGKAPETLPALRIEVTGKVTASNLAEFKETALAAIRSVNRELTTDTHFADAEKAVKWCSEIETRLAAAKQHALSQTASIDALFKAIDDISAEARRVRLDLDKLVTRRKTEVKEEAVTAARRALAAHVTALNAELSPAYLPPPPADFAGAIKGKRSIDSMQEALDTTLAAGKIAADAAARGIRANLATFKDRATGFEFLFADLGQVLHKAADDFSILLQARIDAHKAAEAEKLRKAQEAEAAEAARVAAAAAQAATAPVEAPAAAPAPVAAAPVAAPAVMQLRPAAPIPAPKVDEPATLKLGVICARLGFTMTAAFVSDTLGVQPAKAEGAAKLYRESDFMRICAALRDHIARIAEPMAA